MKSHFASNKDTIYQNCNFRCYHLGKSLIPDIQDPDNDSVI